MATLKPIKRSTQLAPLSREHHDSLLFTWKIKRGLNNGTEVSEIAAYVHWYWNNFLKQHFGDEEDILTAKIAQADEQVRQMKSEHEKIKTLICGSLNKEILALLADMINAHIRFEERRLFPYLEQKLNEEQLNIIYDQLNHHPQCNEKWENEFWIKKK